MPRYFVYRAKTGQIVHVHEKVDFTSGESVPCTDEEVLALIDDSLRADELGIVQSDIGRRSVEQVLLVDVETQLVVEGSRSAPEN